MKNPCYFFFCYQLNLFGFLCERTNLWQGSWVRIDATVPRVCKQHSSPHLRDALQTESRKKQNKKTLERQTLSEEEYDEKETEWMLYLENKTKSLQKSKEWAQKEIHQRAFSVCCFFKLAWNFSRLTEVLITYNLHLDDNKSREFELSVVPTTTSQLQQM